VNRLEDVAQRTRERWALGPRPHAQHTIGGEGTPHSGETPVGIEGVRFDVVVDLRGAVR
jgi:hypothetical protein